MKPTVLLASSSKVRLKSWVSALEDPFNIIGEVSSAQTAEAIIRAENPALAVIDLVLEGGSALDVLKNLGSERPITVVITPSPSHPAALEACGLGATDVLTEPSGERLAEVLTKVFAEKV